MSREEELAQLKQERRFLLRRLAAHLEIDEPVSIHLWAAINDDNCAKVRANAQRILKLGGHLDCAHALIRK